MESAQKELVRVLLDRLHSLGLISDSTHSGALELVYSAMEFQDFFRQPVCLAEEAGGHEHTTGAP